MQARARIDHEARKPIAAAVIRSDPSPVCQLAAPRVLSALSANGFDGLVGLKWNLESAGTSVLLECSRAPDRGRTSLPVHRRCGSSAPATPAPADDHPSGHRIPLPLAWPGDSDRGTSERPDPSYSMLQPGYSRAPAVALQRLESSS